MRQHTAIGYTLVMAVLGLAGCATLNDVVQEKNQGGGTAQVYPVDTDQAWRIALTVFRWEGSDAIEEHRDQGYMLTSSGMNLVSAGAVMGAWVEPAGRDQTKVTVVTKRRMATNIATTLTETTFHKRFGQAVTLVKAGQPLPMRPPD
jgi:hypothetical protein